MNIDSRGFQAFDWTLSLTHLGSYLNVDDILATSERLPCRIQSAIPKVAPLLMGSAQSARRLQRTLDNDSQDNDVPAGTKVELPFWLLAGVGANRRQMFTIELPTIYRESYREVFAADPWVVDLRKRCPYYYSFGCHLTEIATVDAPAVIATVEDAFQRRIKNIMEVSLNANKGSILKITSRLDELEQALFRVGREGRHSMDRWFERVHERLEASTVAKDAQLQREIEEKSALLAGGGGEGVPALKRPRSDPALTQQNRSPRF